MTTREEVTISISVLLETKTFWELFVTIHYLENHTFHLP